MRASQMALCTVELTANIILRLFPSFLLCPISMHLYCLIHLLNRLILVFKTTEFQWEADIVSKLQHLNVVAFYVLRKMGLEEP